MLAEGKPGGVGTAFISAAAERGEIQLFSFVTVKVYDPEASPVTVVSDPEPAEVTGPGYRFRVHDPEGNPASWMLPDCRPQVGCVTGPIRGAAGRGLTVTVTLSVIVFTGTEESVIMTVYVVVTRGATLGFCKPELKPGGSDVQE
jgi:hypothetical protein